MSKLHKDSPNIHKMNEWIEFEKIPKFGNLRYSNHPPVHTKFDCHTADINKPSDSNYSWTNHTCTSPCLCLQDWNTDTAARGIQYNELPDVRPWDLDGSQYNPYPITVSPWDISTRTINQESPDQYCKHCNLTICDRLIYLNLETGSMIEVISINSRIYGQIRIDFQLQSIAGLKVKLLTYSTVS